MFLVLQDIHEKNAIESKETEVEEPTFFNAHFPLTDVSDKRVISAES